MFIAWGGGGGGEGISGGEGYMVFRGNGGGISRRQQSIKEEGEGHSNTANQLWRDQVSFVVREPKSSHPTSLLGD